MSEPDCSQQAYAEERHDHDLRQLEARLAEVDAALGAWGRNEAGDAATIIRIAKAVGAADSAAAQETVGNE